MNRTLAAKIETLKNYTVNSIDTVNSNNKSSNTVNSNKTVSEKINGFLIREEITPEGVAQTLAEGLGDAKSLNYYRILAKENDCGKLLEALSYTRDADLQGKIRTKKAIYFQAILRRRWNIKTKFKRV